MPHVFNYAMRDPKVELVGTWLTLSEKLGQKYINITQSQNNC